MVHTCTYQTKMYKLVYTSMYMDRLSHIGTYQYVLVHRALYLFMPFNYLSMVCQFTCQFTHWYILVCTPTYQFIPYITISYHLVLSCSVWYNQVLPCTLLSTSYLNFNLSQYQEVPAVTLNPVPLNGLV